jgi:gamma-glutamylcysteine synthetase
MYKHCCQYNFFNKEVTKYKKEEETANSIPAWQTHVKCQYPSVTMIPFVNIHAVISGTWRNWTVSTIPPSFNFIPTIENE